MQPASRPPSRFPLVFELLIWSFYVGLYKYAHYLDQTISQPGADQANFPYPQLILFALAATLYIVPYYRWLLPRLLRQPRYAVLLVVAIPYLWWGIKVGAGLAAGFFALLAVPPILREFYHAHQLSWPAVLARHNPEARLLLSDILAFSCVGFVRYAFENETRRRRLEQDHLALQLSQLKAQLQPHFLFNTLNSIYGLSLAGSPETPRFILLLSELMRYVLYDSGKDHVALTEEVAFLENYFEMEQRKYAGANICFAAAGTSPAGLRVPPLLLLPLVENSFKHGRHHVEDAASVEATLTLTPGTLRFVVENDFTSVPPAGAPRRSGGIGLQNIRQRLQLYYPSAHELHLSTHAGRYRAELILHL